MMPPPGNQAVRSSPRASYPPNRNNLGVLMIEGHGEWRVGNNGNRANFIVPDAVEIVIYQGIGVGLDDGAHGQGLAQNVATTARLPTSWDHRNGEYDTDPGGAVRANTPGRRIYRGGEECPDLTLLNPQEPGADPFNPQPGSFTTEVGHPLTLRAIAQHAGPGHQLRWVCCTVLR